MGAYLSKPLKNKIHEIGENESIRFALCTMQGWRIHQEDSHNCIPDFGPDVSLFAVYDGHGGSEVSQYLAEYFPEFLKQKSIFTNDNIADALKHFFVDFDGTLRSDDTVKIMSAMKEVDLPKKPEEINDSEEAERKERESLYDEAVTLSKEANISLDKIIKEYAKCRNILIENAITAEEMRGSKRPVTAPSPQVLKRRKFNKSDEKESHEEEENIEKNNLSSNGEVVRPDTSDAEIKVESKKVARMEYENSKDNSNGNVDVINNQPKQVDGKTTDFAHPSEAENLNANLSSNQQQQISSSDQEHKTEASVSSTSYDNKPTNEEADEDDEDDSDYKVEEDEDSEADDDEDGEEENGNEGAEEGEESVEDESLDEEDIGSLLHAAETGTKAGFDSGSTACMALIFKDRIVVANIGDSRAVLCREGKAVDLSTDHKPEDAEEKKRIELAGGHVGEDGRVNGGLNLSRAFGDHFYKQKDELPLHEQMITSMPEITITERDEQDDYLVLACDGIWNQMSSEELCKFVSERIDKMNLKELTAEICEHCCAPDTTGDGSGCDNETVILIDLKKNRTKIEC